MPLFIVVGRIKYKTTSETRIPLIFMLTNNKQLTTMRVKLNILEVVGKPETIGARIGQRRRRKTRYGAWPGATYLLPVVSDILDITFVANPVMHHLLLGIDPVELGGTPFALTTDEAMNLPAREMGIIANENKHLGDCHGRNSVGLHQSRCALDDKPL